MSRPSPGEVGDGAHLTWGSARSLVRHQRIVVDTFGPTTQYAALLAGADVSLTADQVRALSDDKRPSNVDEHDVWVLRGDDELDSPSGMRGSHLAVLKRDQLGELGRDVCHRLFCSAQAASRAEQGLTSRRASYVVSCTIGTSRSPARSAESSLSAMPSPGRRRSSAGVTSTIPTREFAKPLSMARSNGTPRPTSFSLNQTVTPLTQADRAAPWRLPPVVPRVAEKDVPKVRQRR